MQELWLGPGPAGSLFCSREELQAAWAQYRSECMRLWGSRARRPMAWWCLEAPGLGLKWPGYDAEKSYLYEAGVLSAEERAEVERDLMQNASKDGTKRVTKAERRRRKKEPPSLARGGEVF